MSRKAIAADASPRGRRFRFDARMTLAIMLVVLLAAAQLASRGTFLQPQNLINILSQNSIAGTLAVGQTLVVLTGGIDLSLGSITALSSIVVLLLQDVGPVEARLAGLAVGIGCGLINGLLVTVGRVPPFIATLGMMQGALGLAYVISNGYSIYETEHVPLFFGLDRIGPLPLLVLVWLAIVVLAWVFVRRTRYGAYTYAVGGNERAARVSGVNTDRVKVVIYMIAGACAAIAGILTIDRLGYSQPTIGNDFTLASIAPVVVGGTSLFGGVGGVWLTTGGVMVMGILNNLMVILGVNVYVEQVIQGVIILVVVFGFIKFQKR